MPISDVLIWSGRADEQTARLELLSAEEQEKAGRYPIAERRIVFVTARSVLRKLLAAKLGTSPEHVPIRIGERGKPYLENASVSFNVSHSGNWILIAIAEGREIGVDIEQINPKRPLERLADRFYHEEEKAELKARPSTKTFFEIWTRKEAYLKLEGGGIDRELSSFSVWQSTPSGIYLSTIEAPAGYCAAIALRGTAAPTISRPSLLP